MYPTTQVAPVVVVGGACLRCRRCATQDLGADTHAGAGEPSKPFLTPRVLTTFCIAAEVQLRSGIERGCVDGVVEALMDGHRPAEAILNVLKVLRRVLSRLLLHSNAGVPNTRWWISKETRRDRHVWKRPQRP